MRHFFVCIVCCLLCFVQPAKAESMSPARLALEVSITRILDHIKNPAYQDKTTRKKLYDRIKEEIYLIFDFNEFAMRTAGPRWRTFEDAEKKAFTEAFASLLFATYLNRLDGYNGERITYTSEVSNRSKTRFEIRTLIILKNGNAVPVAYRMLPKNSTWRVYDVLIEGISLVQNYRSQFGVILASDGHEVLTERILERAAALEVENNEGL